MSKSDGSTIRVCDFLPCFVKFQAFQSRWLNTQKSCPISYICRPIILKRDTIYSLLPPINTLILLYISNAYMFFAGWEARMVKKLWPRAWKWTDPKPANKCLFFPAVNWFCRLQMGLFTQLCHWIGWRAVYYAICKKSLQRTSWVTQILNKKRCIKEQIFFDLLYVSCIYTC